MNLIVTLIIKWALLGLQDTKKPAVSMSCMAPYLSLSKWNGHKNNSNYHKQDNERGTQQQSLVAE